MSEPKAFFLFACLALLPACASKEVGPPWPQASNCCQEYGIDVNRILGSQGINCGYVDEDFDRKNVRRGMQSAIGCAREALAVGRPFVVGLMNSDGFMFDHVVVVLGENGEKIYITDHSDCEGREFGIGDCTALTIDAEGYIRADGCKWNDEALLSRLKPPAASQR